MGPSRRSIISWWPVLGARAAVVDRSPVIGSETRRFVDPATENTVLRLTDPAFSSVLPSAASRPFTQRGNGLLYASDRGGSWQAYRLDVKSGQSRQLTLAAGLNAKTVALSADERTLYYVDGRELHQLTLLTKRDRVLDQGDSSWQVISSPVVSDDSTLVGVADSNGSHARVRVIPIRFGTPANIHQTTGKVLDLAFRPRSASLSFRRDDGSLWLVSRGREPQRIGAADGRCSHTVWSADGNSLFYLHSPEDRVVTIREFVVEAREDRLVSRTSQFAQFARNADATVFAGLSGSKAAPYLLVLVRKVKRELTLCEHRASDASTASVLFAPNSQRVYFESDRFGKPALMAMSVDRVVTATDEE